MSYPDDYGDMSDRFPNIAEIIDSASVASQIQDWTTVIQSLQKLPVDRSGKKLIFSNSKEGDRSLYLALEVLKYGDFRQQWDIAKFFPKFGKIAIEPLTKIAGDVGEEIETRWLAARILAEFNTIESILALVGLLKETTEEELSSIAAQSLANMGASAIESLNSLIDRESLRLPAVTALACMRHSETIAPLLRVTEDRNEKIRILAIEALGSFRDSRIPPILIDALTDFHAAVRKEAVAALGMRADLAGELNLVDRLAPLLYDLNPEVCRQAALALGRIGTADAIEALYKVLQAPLTPIELKLDLVRSLAWNSTEKALECLQMSLKDAEMAVCREIIAVLGLNLPDCLREKACTILMEFFTARKKELLDPQIKQTLVTSLRQLGDKRAIETLSILAEDDDRSVSLHAKAALESLSAH